MNYRNKVILAPMVRIGTLPTRLLALKYGADIVYSEEIIDHKILSAQRFENEVLGTVDYVLSDTTLVFRTHPLEKGRIVFQMGTANAETALRAAQKMVDDSQWEIIYFSVTAEHCLLDGSMYLAKQPVASEEVLPKDIRRAWLGALVTTIHLREGDVSAIDINMGCPKEFSLKGGMGAALLKKPETVKKILTTLVKGLSIPVTCKIRLLPELEDNLKFVKMIEETGVSALGIHGRLTEERPRHPNRNHTIKQLAETLSLPVIANGGSKEIQCYEDIDKFRRNTGASSVMIARAAQWNTSIFRKEGKLPVKEVVKEYLKIAIDMDNPFPNTKYCILNLMHADMDQQEGLNTQDSKCLDDICDIWGFTDYIKEVRRNRKLKQETIDRYHGIKRRKTEDGSILVEMPIRFIKKDYPVGISPKLRLYEWTKKMGVDKPVYSTSERPEDRCFKSVLSIDGKKYTATLWEKSKQLAEQAAAIVGSIVLGVDYGRKPNTESSNDDIIKVWKTEFEVKNVDNQKHEQKLSTDKCDIKQNENDISKIIYENPAELKKVCDEGFLTDTLNSKIDSKTCNVISMKEDLDECTPSNSESRKRKLISEMECSVNS